MLAMISTICSASCIRSSTFADTGYWVSEGTRSTLGARAPGHISRSGQLSSGKWAARRDGAELRELRPVEAGPADQRAVDVGLGEDLPDVVRLDRAAVEQPHAACHVLPVQLGEGGPQRAAHLLGVGRARHAARA